MCSRWALRHKYSVVAVTEIMVKMTSEVPDVLAFKASGQSTLFEIKVDRGDFKSDAKKSFRVNEDAGIGLYRYYVVPEGLIQPQELPEGWGLLWFRPSDGKCFVKATSKRFLKRNHRAEAAMLVSALRRVGSLIVGRERTTGVSCKAYTIPTTGRTALYLEGESEEDTDV